MLISRPPWEQESSAVGPSTFGPAQVPAEPPPPVIGRWKVTLVERGSKLEEARQNAAQQAEITGVPVNTGEAAENELALLPDHTVHGSFRQDIRISAGPWFTRYAVSGQTTGKWRYNSVNQRLELQTTQQGRLENFELETGEGMEFDETQKRQVERQIRAQISNPVSSNDIYYIEEGDSQHFDARDQNDNLWRFHRVS